MHPDGACKADIPPMEDTNDMAAEKSVANAGR